MMLNPSVSQLLQHVNNRYLLVNVIADRARRISTAEQESGTPSNEKPVSCAIEDIAEGKINIKIDA